MRALATVAAALALIAAAPAPPASSWVHGVVRTITADSLTVAIIKSDPDNGIVAGREMTFAIDRATRFVNGLVPGGPIDPKKICPTDKLAIFYVERSGRLVAYNVRPTDSTIAAASSFQGHPRCRR